MTHKQTTRRPRLMAMSFVAVGVALALMLTWGHNVANEADAATTGAKTQMDLVVNGGECDSAVQAKCTLVLDETFTLSVVPSIIPDVAGGGYFGFQSFVEFGSLVYKPTEDEADEITFAGGTLPLRLVTPSHVLHADLLCLAEPCPPASMQKTAIVSLEFNCLQQNPAGAFSQTVSMVSWDDHPNGALFVDPDLSTSATFSVPNLGALEINCEAPTPTPTPAPAPVGGVAFEPEVASLAQQTSGGAGHDAILWTSVAVAGVLASIAFGGSATWFARRRAAE